MNHQYLKIIGHGWNFLMVAHHVEEQPTTNNHLAATGPITMFLTSVECNQAFNWLPVSICEVSSWVSVPTRSAQCLRWRKKWSNGTVKERLTRRQGVPWRGPVQWSSEAVDSLPRLSCLQFFGCKKVSETMGRVYEVWLAAGCTHFAHDSITLWVNHQLASL